jgi:hypothetical protein
MPGLAQATLTPEKRRLYLKMASVWHQMAQRWEKKVSRGGDKRSTRGAADFGEYRTLTGNTNAPQDVCSIILRLAFRISGPRR